MTDRVVSLSKRLWIKRKMIDNVFLIDIRPHVDFSALYRDDKHKSINVTARPFLRSASRHFSGYYHYEILHRMIVDMSSKQIVAEIDIENPDGGLCVRDGHSKGFNYYYLRPIYGDVDVVSFFNYVIGDLRSSFDDLSSFNLHVKDFDVLQRWMYREDSGKYEDAGDPVNFHDLRFDDNPIREEIIRSMNRQGFNKVYLYNKNGMDADEDV